MVLLLASAQEKEPMGTAGPLALARELLDDGSGQPFFVLNSDVVCEYPLKEMLEFHRARGAESTILVTKVRGLQVGHESIGVLTREKWQ